MSARCQPSITKVSEQDRAQFTHKQKATVSHGIWMILSRKAAEFCKLARGVWKIFCGKLWALVMTSA